ncbi:MAG: exo-alpha-sialidase [Verrucomicrobia bacterium]|nr:exo-alpha-sialidase [Verrucomicrobiota bacterium]
MKLTSQFLCLALALAQSSPAAEQATVLETKVISQQPQHYHGWPTLLRKRDGTLIVVVSGGRQGHVCPFGRVEWMTSRDEGRTWTFPRTILDTDVDDRDAGALETPKGTLLVTTFTSLAYEKYLGEHLSGKDTHFISATNLPAWSAAHARLTDGQRKAQPGEWLVRSTDRGLSWSPPIRTLVNSPHGPTALADGRLLYVGKELWTEQKRIGACESTDDGLTWKWLAQIPTRPGDSAAGDYHELHAVQANDGRIIAHIRHHGKTNNKETLQTESADGGRTWSEPHGIGVWGYPSHLLKLRDGALLMSYGHRRAPLGNQARVSRDGGRTWSAPLIISSDATSGDLGYPSTVELNDGSLLTVWYEKLKDNANAVLRQAKWTIKK